MKFIFSILQKEIKMNLRLMIQGHAASSFVSPKNTRLLFLLLFISFTFSSFYSSFWTVILIGISIASFGMSFSWRVFHSGIWSVYASVFHPENGFGIATFHAREKNFYCGTVTVLNLKVKGCVTRNALKTEENKRRIIRLDANHTLFWTTARSRENRRLKHLQRRC